MEEFETVVVVNPDITEFEQRLVLAAKRVRLLPDVVRHRFRVCPECAKVYAPSTELQKIGRCLSCR